MAHWVMIKGSALARGRAVAVFLDLHEKGPQSFMVALSYTNILYYMSEYLTKEWAYELAEEIELCWAHPYGDISLKAVLERISNDVHKRQAQEVDCSAAVHATRSFNVGSWNWIVTLIKFRNGLISKTS